MSFTLTTPLYYVNDRAHLGSTYTTLACDAIARFQRLRGEEVIFINSQSKGWDGTHRGKPQPVGVYVYVLRATLSNGTVVNKKGSITLLR